MVKIKIVKLPPESYEFAKELEDTLSKAIARKVKSRVSVDNGMENIEITVYEQKQMASKTIKVGDKFLKVKLAQTPEQQQRGLMNVQGMGPTKLPKDEGMLFVYRREEILSFWMKNTTLPLSIAFINKKGIITQIEKMEPLKTDSVRSAERSLYALEVNRGWFTKNNINVGDKVKLDFPRVNLSIQPKMYPEE